MPNSDANRGVAGRAVFAVACLILVAQAAGSHMLQIDEKHLPLPGLHELPFQVGAWNAGSEGMLEEGVAAYLKPDEYILRDYASRQNGGNINLFVAYFKSLQNTYGPHSPRVCLPGSGWLVRGEKKNAIAVPGRSEPITVNQFLMEKSDNRILVLYWYQNGRAVWSDEFWAKLRLLPDLLRYRRSDVSLVRVITPVSSSSGDAELSKAVDFARTLFPQLVSRFDSI